MSNNINKNKEKKLKKFQPCKSVFVQKRLRAKVFLSMFLTPTHK